MSLHLRGFSLSFFIQFFDEVGKAARDGVIELILMAKIQIVSQPFQILMMISIRYPIFVQKCFVPTGQGGGDFFHGIHPLPIVWFYSRPRNGRIECLTS